MAPKHKNPQNRGRTAVAPYNFIPLPEKVVTAYDEADSGDNGLPAWMSHDTYHEEGLTGWIDCNIETQSPTYIRGMMTEAIFKELGDSKKELTPKEKEIRAPFFSAQDKKVEGYFQPTIPGSSLRGMIRQLVEIISYGRMRWVDNSSKSFIRAVAAPHDDPLRAPYEQVIGRFSKNVRAGYFLQDGENWYIMPARKWATGETFIKIKDKKVQSLGLSGYVPFNDSNYKPQLHKVSFDAKTERGKRGRFIDITGMGPRKTHRIAGNLICAGNMLESNQTRSQTSPRKNQTLVLLPNADAMPLKINPQAIVDYNHALTPFQRDDLGDWSKGKGCLGHLNPVFYVTDKSNDEVVAFGHNPNFRIPAWKAGSKQAATPLDFVPEHLRKEGLPDFADAIFGWVEELDKDGDIVGPTGQYAGRVFFGDARFEGSDSDIWGKMITPKILASPKPSTFQHYLTQNSPNRKKELSHYASSSKNTQIRGYKRYWHKGSQPDIEETKVEDKNETQLTRIIPLNVGVRFNCRIHFENMRPEELGALWWALALPGDVQQTYHHKIGMGKPLGMGALSVTPKLHLVTPDSRYNTLFNNDDWQESEQNTDATECVTAFEQHILKTLHGGKADSRQLAKEPRIKMLLAMLQWREGNNEWLEQTRYMEIERGAGKTNEYKDRPVLPDPLHVG